MKKFEFVNEAAKRAFLDLPRDVMRQFGADLQAVQNDERPFSDYKHLKDSVGPGAIELIENGSPAYRAVYCAKLPTRFSFSMHSPRPPTGWIARQ